MVDQLADVQRAPERRLRVEQTNLNRVGSALSSLTAEFGSLLTKAKALTATQLYNSRGVVSGDKSVATASVDSGANSGSYSFNLIQLATSASQRGGADAGMAIDPNADITSSSAGFSVAVRTGQFTINGSQIDVQSGDSLHDILARINTKTGLTANYDSATDKVSLSDSGGAPITLGSAADTSNFLQAARITNNGTASVSSGFQLGGINVANTLASARFNTAVTSGDFSINGVSISVDADHNTVGDVLNSINQSAAGVTASFDSINDRFILSNKSSGDVGISLAEGTSNFLSAAKLTSASGGVLANGQDAQFTVNGGPVLTSRSNVLTSAEHGIAGLTVTALTQGNSAISVQNDTTSAKQAITDFVDEYNKIQNLISVQTASSTDSKGTVTAGLLAGDAQVAESSRTLRGLFTSDALGSSGTIKRLESLGFKGDGYSNELSLANPGALESALANSPSDVQALFTDKSIGIATRVENYMEGLVGADGSMSRHQSAISDQSTKIDDQVNRLEKTVLGSRQLLIDSFRNMEQTLSQINRQAAFFTQRFGVG